MSGNGAQRPPACRRAPGTTQLELLEAGATSWRLDRHTRDIGRQGVAKAREVLRSVSGSQAPDGRRRAA
ncbi:MAG: hypothetical protein ACR2G7_09515 [Acidimicrobiales bacterium]